jgi:hypothetical protein
VKAQYTSKKILKEHREKKNCWDKIKADDEIIVFLWAYICRISIYLHIHEVWPTLLCANNKQ